MNTSNNDFENKRVSSRKREILICVPAPQFRRYLVCVFPIFDHGFHLGLHYLLIFFSFLTQQNVQGVSYFYFEFHKIFKNDISLTRCLSYKILVSKIENRIQIGKKIGLICDHLMLTCVQTNYVYNPHSQFTG